MLMVISKLRTVASLDDVNEARRHLTGRDQGEGRSRRIAPLHLEHSQLRDGLMAVARGLRVSRQPRRSGHTMTSGNMTSGNMTSGNMTSGDMTSGDMTSGDDSAPVAAQMQVHGALMVGFAQACVNLHIVAGRDATSFIQGLQINDWYPFSEWERL